MANKVDKQSRKAIWLVEDEKVIQKRPRICDHKNFKPFYTSAEQARKHLPKKAVFFLDEDGEIVQKRLPVAEHDQFDPHWKTKAEAQAARDLDYTLAYGSLSIYYNDEIVTVTKSDNRYIKLRKACREDDINTIFRLMNLTALMETETSAFKLKGNKITLDGDFLPESLSTKIVGLLKSGDTKTLENFWERLKKNPDENVRENLYKFLSEHGMALTEDGCFIAYKYVNKDFTDSHTGKLDYSPGKTVKLDRSKCNNNPNESCSSGLHVGTWGYSGQGKSTVLLTKIDPYNVVSVPNDYDCQKMRCCEVTSVKQVTQPYTSELVSNKELATA